MYSWNHSNNEVGRDLLLELTLLKQGQLEQIAQVYVQLGLTPTRMEILQLLWTTFSSVQSLSFNKFSCIQTGFHAYQDGITYSISYLHTLIRSCNIDHCPLLAKQSQLSQPFLT